MNTNEDLYELQWNNHSKVLKRTFADFRMDNELVDVTLSCEGKKIKGHKIVLSACSTYFLDLFRDNPCQHPIVILRDIKYQAMLDILSFMYIGEVNVAMENLNIFLQTAELLQVKGLSEGLPNISNMFTAQLTKDLKEKVNEKSTVEITGKKESVPNSKNRIEANSKPETERSNNTEVDIKSEESSVHDLTVDDDSLEYINFNPIDFGINRLYAVDKSNDTGQNQTFPCSYCDKVFSHQISLKLHLPSHTGATSCALCSAVLSRKYELKVHMRRRHNLDIDSLHMK